MPAVCCAPGRYGHWAARAAAHVTDREVATMSPSTGIRANAVVPGGVITNIEAEFRSEQAAAVVGPVLQATLPSVAARNR